MSSHTRGPRKRSRKARPSAASEYPSAAPAAKSPAGGRAAPRALPSPRRTFGERPQAPWHPLPLSELLILAGGIGAAIGLSRGVLGGGRLMLAGVAAVALGTIEVTLREHRSGFRSHTLLLALLPVIVFHTVMVLLIGAFTMVPPLLNLGLVAVDVALFAVLFRLWRARFLDARVRAASRR